LKKALLFSGLIFAATILLATPTLQAGVKERYIVQHNGNSRGLKLGHAVKAQGRGWFAFELD